MKSVGSVLSHFLDRIASDEEIALIFLSELWPQIVGKDLASKSRPLALRDKRLLLSVPSEIWAKELAQLRKMLVHTVNKHWDLGLVESIDFEVRSTNKE
jgi:predicted nucleic acid-binding Zn ribbon protein